MRPTSCRSAAASRRSRAQARMQLRRLAAQRRDADRVLEQPAGVAVVPLGARGRERAVRRADLRVAEHGRDGRASPGWVISPARKSRKPSSSSASRRSPGVSSAGSASGAASTRPHLHLQPAAEPLHAAEHADGVSLGEAAVEELDVVPDARVDAAARVDELEREVGGAVLRPPPLLAPDREHALDGPVLGELGDAGHVRSLDLDGCTLGRWPTSPRFALSASRIPPRR